MDEGARAAARQVVDWAARTALSSLLPRGGLEHLAGWGVQRALDAARALGGRRLAEFTNQLLASTPVSGAIGRISHAAEGAARRVMMQVADQPMKPGFRRAAGSMVRVATGSTVDQFSAAARRAAGAGALIDGIASGIDATRAYQQGEITGRQVVVRIALDATTGAIAAGAGVALGACAVIVLGGLSAPALFVVGATGSLGAKQALRWLFD